MYKCKLKIKDSEVSVTLPITIGSSFEDNIYVNSENLKHSHYFIFRNNNFAKCKDYKGKEVSLDVLKEKYAIEVLYVFKDTDSELQKIFRKESQHISRMSVVVRGIALASFPLFFRIVLLLVSIGLLGLLYTNISQQNLNVSRSYSMKTRKIDPGYVDSSVYTKENYPYGVSFNFILEKNKADLPMRLSFDASGYSEDGAIFVKINDHLIFASVKEESCLKSICKQHKVLKSSLLKIGKNELTSVHRYPQEEWKIEKVEIENLRPFTYAEVKEFEHYLRYAQEKFEQRSLSPHSVLYTEVYLEKIEKLKQNKFLSVEQLANYQSLKKEADIFVDNFISEFWFNFGRNIKAKNYEAAQDDLIKMRAFYPNASTKRGRILERELSGVRSLMGVEK